MGNEGDNILISAAVSSKQQKHEVESQQKEVANQYCQNSKQQERETLQKCLIGSEFLQEVAGERMHSVRTVTQRDHLGGSIHETIRNYKCDLIMYNFYSAFFL